MDMLIRLRLRRLESGYWQATATNLSGVIALGESRGEALERARAQAIVAMMEQSDRHTDPHFSIDEPTPGMP